MRPSVAPLHVLYCGGAGAGASCPRCAAGLQGGVGPARIFIDALSMWPSCACLLLAVVLCLAASELLKAVTGGCKPQRGNLMWLFGILSFWDGDLAGEHAGMKGVLFVHCVRWLSSKPLLGFGQQEV